MADAIVDAMRRQWWLLYFVGITLLGYVAQALFEHGFRRGCAIVLIALYVVLLPWTLWQRRTTFANYDRLEPTRQP